jgi:hypothetical protein
MRQVTPASLAPLRYPAETFPYSFEAQIVMIAPLKAGLAPSLLNKLV